MGVTPAQLLEQLASVRRGTRKGVRAPHKPLLLLVALARLQQGKQRLAAF
jgi:putative restriction endonuclease